MNCVIVEDNPRDSELLEHYITKEPFLRLLRSFSHALEALTYIDTFQPPLLFLDIDMPLIRGIDLYKKITYKPICIFVTSHGEFAVESYETEAFDFILKPVNAERLHHAITRLQEYEELKKQANLYNAQFDVQSLLLKEGTTTHRIAMNDILYIEALSDYSKVVTKARKYITLSKLKHFLEKLPAKDFMRVHRSYAVAIKAVEKMAGNELFIGAHKLPVGKTYKPQLKAHLFS